MLSIFSRLWNSSSDVLYWRLQLISSVLVGLAFVVGFWTVRVGARANRRANSELSDTKLRAARLEKEAAEAKLELEKIKLPRFDRFNGVAFREAIRGQPKIRVELLYQKDDVDSYMLADRIKGALAAEGWTTIGPRPIQEEDIKFSQVDKDAPMSVRADVMYGGIAYVTNRVPAASLSDPIHVLVDALTVMRRGFGVRETSAVFGGTIDPSLPDDLVKLFIGPRYHDW